MAGFGFETRLTLATLTAAALLTVAACTGVVEGPGEPTESMPGPPVSPKWTLYSPEVTGAEIPEGVVAGVPVGQAKDCQDTTSPFTCGGKFRAVIGHDGQADLTWVRENDVRIEAVLMNDQTTLVIMTPCNAINLPVTVSQGLLTPGEASQSLVNCQGLADDQEKWIRELVAKPFKFSFHGSENLVLTADAKQLILVRI